MRQPKPSFKLRKVTESRLFFPLVTFALILLFDLIVIPGFFNIQVREGNLYGSLIDILRNGSAVSLLAIGMTLVIATGGVDLSVGAVMAIAASVAAVLMNPYVLATELPPNLMKLIKNSELGASMKTIIVSGDEERSKDVVTMGLADGYFLKGTPLEQLELLVCKLVPVSNNQGTTSLQLMAN